MKKLISIVLFLVPFTTFSQSINIVNQCSSVLLQTASPGGFIGSISSLTFTLSWPTDQQFIVTDPFPLAAPGNAPYVIGGRTYQVFNGTMSMDTLSINDSLPILSFSTDSVLVESENTPNGSEYYISSNGIDITGQIYNLPCSDISTGGSHVVYNNPSIRFILAQGILNIILTNNRYGQLQLIDMSGRILYSGSIKNKDIVPIDMNNTRNGQYLVKLYDNSQPTIVIRVMIIQ